MTLTLKQISAAVGAIEIFFTNESLPFASALRFARIREALLPALVNLEEEKQKWVEELGVLSDDGKHIVLDEEAEMELNRRIYEKLGEKVEIEFEKIPIARVEKEELRIRGDAVVGMLPLIDFTT